MRLNSKILKVSILIALIFILIPMVAAEDTTDTVYTEEQSVDESPVAVAQDDAAADELADDDQSTDDTSEDASDVDVTGVASDESADLEIIAFATPSKVKVGDYIIFNFMVFNYGPDTAVNTVAYTGVSQGDITFIDVFADKGIFDPISGIWLIGDLEPGELATAMVICQVIGDTPIVFGGYVISDTPDPNEYNNFDIEMVPVESEDAAPEPETLPATGNPVMLALLALIGVVGVSLRRKL